MKTCFLSGGPIKPLSASNAYTRREIEQILTLAHDNELKVIPLIQTFGHLEFGLKLPEFAKLREVAQHPQALCPSKNGSRELIQNMVDQVMTLHKTSHWLHIGCDEVYQLGQCSSCIQRLRNHDKNWIFLQHVKWVAEYVKKTHKVQPIIWDDMLRTVSERDLQEHLGDGLVEPMVWVYVSHVERFVDPTVWRKFSRVFSTVWGAGAF
uniref:beta-N-acetylhexosaminidase n=1 Tax=Strigamia maritima TaxID=126957 RepID=T1IV77_STRMM